MYHVCASEFRYNCTYTYQLEGVDEAIVGKDGERIAVVTNNPLLKEEDEVLFVEGTFRDVLVKVRDLVYEGHKLVTHPLFASSRMMFSPFRTVIVGERQEKPSEFECQIIENSIQSYDIATAHRNRQPEHDDDYAFLDQSLYQAALEELEQLS